jgi:hypothetical protein
MFCRPARCTRGRSAGRPEVHRPACRNQSRMMRSFGRKSVWSRISTSGTRIRQALQCKERRRQHEGQIDGSEQPGLRRIEGKLYLGIRILILQMIAAGVIRNGSQRRGKPRQPWVEHDLSCTRGMSAIAGLDGGAAGTRGSLAMRAGTWSGAMVPRHRRRIPGARRSRALLQPSRPARFHANGARDPSTER